MSESATCLTKSAVDGLTPSMELTPVFSPTDWAKAGAATKATNMHAVAIIVRLMRISPSAGGLTVDAFSQRHRVELGVGRLFLVEIGGEEANDVVVAELLGPGDQGAIPRDLIVLDGLCAGDDRGVQYGLVLDFAGRVVGLLDQAIDRRTVGSLRRLAELLEDLVEALDLPFGFLEMSLQTLRQIAVGRLVDHLGQRLGDLLFGIVDVV